MNLQSGAARRTSHKARRTPVIARSAAVAALALSLTVGGTTGTSASPAGPAGGGEAAVSRLAFHDETRKLWEDHITWTRLSIVSFAGELPDLAPTLQRLFRNQDDLGNSFKPFFGERTGNELTALLREHIQGAVDILVAAKAGDRQQLEAAIAAWYANGEEIADFLSALNPKFWPQDETRAMMREHLDLTLEEATHRLQGDFEADIQDYDEVHNHILGFADFLSCGIIKKFPDQFRKHPKADAICP
ncbi:hypothetical protein [Streptomyces sp. NPDC048603]|uniref:hypothetical protein n=1 Tax=Streptomyces sp. NPDC048603 TaxID=3365577 RepID=UPI0037132968